MVTRKDTLAIGMSIPVAKLDYSADLYEYVGRYPTPAQLQAFLKSNTQPA
jgi:hypothetical protein